VGLVIIFAYSCGPKDGYEGIHKAEGGDSRRNYETQIELKENGQGVWKVFDDEVSFRWEVK